MSKVDDGGSAYPVMPPVGADDGLVSGYPFPETGLTKREAFAMAAMQGLAPRWGKERSGNEIARASVMMADALLAALRGDAND